MAKLICSIACFCCLFFCNVGVLIILNWYYVYLFVCLFVFLGYLWQWRCFFLNRDMFVFIECS